MSNYNFILKLTILYFFCRKHKENVCKVPAGTELKNLKHCNEHSTKIQLRVATILWRMNEQQRKFFDAFRFCVCCFTHSHWSNKIVYYLFEYVCDVCCIAATTRYGYKAIATRVYSHLTQSTKKYKHGSVCAVLTWQQV